MRFMSTFLRSARISFTYADPSAYTPHKSSYILNTNHPGCLFRPDYQETCWTLFAARALNTVGKCVWMGGSHDTDIWPGALSYSNFWHWKDVNMRARINAVCLCWPLLFQIPNYFLNTQSQLSPGITLAEQGHRFVFSNGENFTW